MKTGIKVVENDYINFDTIGVIINISMEDEKELKVYPYQYNANKRVYYIFLRMTDLMKFSMTNEGGTDVFVADKDLIDILQEKSFDGWLIDKIRPL